MEDYAELKKRTKVTMLSDAVKNRLIKNWGDKANALSCYAEVKFIDPLSSWVCYIFAMDENEENLQCLLYSDTLGVEITTQSINELQNKYNEHGEHPVIDNEYRRMRVTEIIRRLRHER